MSPPPTNPNAGEAFAWKVHDAINAWTGKVDTKASIALAIEVAIAGFAITLSTNHRQLTGLHGIRAHLDDIGLAVLFGSMLASLAVVMPQLSRRRARRTWQTNMIYFGHLRHWDPEQLANELIAGNIPSAAQLARQLIEMSRIAWRKHVWLQWSLILLIVASLLLVAAGA